MTLIGLVIRLAPYAVFCFMFNLAALFGWDLLVRLGALRRRGGAGAGDPHVRGVFAGAEVRRRLVAAARSSGASQEAMLMAFSTASSNATLPTALRVADEKLGLPRRSRASC